MPMPHDDLRHLPAVHVESREIYKRSGGRACRNREAIQGHRPRMRDRSSAIPSKIPNCEQHVPRVGNVIMNSTTVH
jgi:hypothetical protein